MTDPASPNAILRAWAATLARRGAAVAVQATSGEAWRTFAEIEAEAAALVTGLPELPRHSIVGVQMGNSPRWPALLLALFRRELIPLPLGRHIEGAERAQVLETFGVSAVAFAREGREIEWQRGPAARPPAWDGLPPDLLKLTSGTTSVPRTIRFRAPQLLADCENICATMGLTERDLNFGVIPFSHSYGFSNLLLPLLGRGIPLVASEERMPRPILNDLARTGATVFPGMPIYFQKFAEMQNVPELPRLRLCLSAGSLLSRSVAEQFTAKFGRKIHTFYGSSECGGISYDRSESPVYVDGFVGEALAGVTIVADRPARGRIEVRGPAVGDGYFPAGEAGTLSPGRFVPGDVVRWSERGLHLDGRSSDVINIAGRKLNPLEVEARLAECPGIRQAVVFGVPSALRGEEAVACVAGDALDAGAVQRFCHSRLSRWQMPRDFWMVREIPTDERGKINRRTLAERFLAQKSRSSKNDPA